MDALADEIVDKLAQRGLDTLRERLRRAGLELGEDGE